MGSMFGGGPRSPFPPPPPLPDVLTGPKFLENRKIDLDGVNIKRRARGLPNLTQQEAVRAVISRPGDESGPDLTGFLVGYLTGLAYSPASVVGAMLHPSEAPASDSFQPMTDYGRSYSETPGDSSPSSSSDSGSSSSYDSGSSSSYDSGSSGGGSSYE